MLPPNGGIYALCEAPYHLCKINQGVHMRNKFRALVVPVFVSALVACGGGGGSTAASPGALTGLAATGAAISGASVSAKCVAGPVLTGTTDANGAFTLTLTSAHTAPCMMQVTGGMPSVTLHSFATASGQVNISPLTDMVVSKALGSDPAAAYAAFDGTKGSAISAGLVAAKAYVQTQVTAITGSGTADPLTSIFAVGGADDKVLDALGAALTAAGKSIADLRTGAQSGAALSNSIPSYLGVPSALQATANSASQIGVSWGGVTGATGYRVYRSTTSGGSSTLVGSPTASPFVDTGLAASTTYYYTVTAVNASVSSLTSSQASATTNASSGTGNAAPSVAAFSPTSGAVGTTVTISGTNLGNFTPAAKVSFGTTVATVSSATTTAIVVTVPTGLTAGNTAVTLSNLDGTGVVSVGTFTVSVAGGGTGGTGAVELGVSTMPAVNTALCTDANPMPYGMAHAYTCPISALASSFNLTIHGTVSIPGAPAKICTFIYDGHNLTASDGTTTNVMPIGGTIPNAFAYTIPSGVVSGSALGLISTADASGNGISFSVQTISGTTMVSGTVPTNKDGSPTVMCSK